MGDVSRKPCWMCRKSIGRLISLVMAGALREEGGMEGGREGEKKGWREGGTYSSHTKTELT